MSTAHADKNFLKGMAKESFYIHTCRYMELKQMQFGLKHLMNLTLEDVDYIRSMRRNGENLNEAPRIKLSTIHSVKGGEARKRCIINRSK